eukprot:scaffold22512_cov36-Phaeocystis_antarctica.AAC.3
MKNHRAGTYNEPRAQCDFRYFFQALTAVALSLTLSPSPSAEPDPEPEPEPEPEVPNPSEP